MRPNENDTAGEGRPATAGGWVVRLICMCLMCGTGHLHHETLRELGRHV